MENLTLLLFATGAAFVQRVSGFGFGIFIMSVLPYLMPSYGEATCLSGLLASITSALIFVQMWRVVPWRKLWLILLTFVVTSAVAVHCVSLIDTRMMMRVLGVILVVVSVYFFAFSSRLRIAPSPAMQVAMGALSGVMGGFFGMQGPPAVLYFVASTDSKEEYTALAQTYFLFGNTAMLASRAMSGFLTPAVGLSWLLCAPAVLVGTWIGGKAYARISIGTLRRIVYAYMAVSGVVALFR